MTANYPFRIGELVRVKQAVRDRSIMPDGGPVPEFIVVERLSYRPGYKTPFIHFASGAFKPSELERVQS